MTEAAVSPAPAVTSLAPVDAFDVARVRQDFPALHQEVHGKPLVYLDSAATAHKPEAVLRAIDGFYRHDNANVHRGVHTLSERATRLYEGARARVRRFLNAAEDREVVFVRGTTEAVNLVATSFGQAFVNAGDEVLITTLEHHSNIVPWQLLCQRSGATLKAVPITDEGALDLGAYERLLGPRTRLVAVAHVSNALGTVNPVKAMIAAAHAHGAAVLVDGAQAVPHMAVDVRDLGADFYAFSGHKLFGPSGIGVLYGQRRWLEAMPPYQGGGDMIASVSLEESTYNELPWKLEAGTGPLAQAAGLAAAIDYVTTLGYEAIAAHEHDLLEYASARLGEVPGLRLVGTAPGKASVVSFVLDGIHPHDIGTVLDREGIAVRTGHHCAQPVMKRLGLPATARASFAFYNTRSEIDALVRGLDRVRTLLG